ncbi:MAG TPA: ATP synthase F0 subunit B [Acidimicrobiales bacterium]
MLYVAVTRQGAGLVSVKVLAAEGEEGSEAETSTESKPPNPIAPELKEVAWGFGSFLLLLILMRFWLFKKLKKGMDARYGKIRSDHESADAVRAAAEADLSAYEAQLVEVRAEASRRLDAARQQLESERQARLAEVNASIGERKAAAVAAIDAQLQAAQAQVEDSVADVAAAIAGRALNTTIDPASIRDTVAEVVRAGVAR